MWSSSHPSCSPWHCTALGKRALRCCGAVRASEAGVGIRPLPELDPACGAHPSMGAFPVSPRAQAGDGV